ncbi:MAG: hypothetical protein MK240_07250, partial [Opitutales bacterium]|nr:hypothetical protein [Opitutales bacterium]
DFQSGDEASDFFGSFVGISDNGAAFGFGIKQVGFFLVAVFILNFFLIYRGLSRGIELFCKYAMPALIILALVVLVRVMTLGTPDPGNPDLNVSNGLGYMWNPTKVLLEEQTVGGDWQKVREIVGERSLSNAVQEASTSPRMRVREISLPEQLTNFQLWLDAAGQIFFSLSIGFGVIINYASYLKRKDDVVLSGLAATSANEFCEVGLGGLMTVPAAFTFLGIAGATGSTLGLGFNALPMVFSSMPAGQLFGFLFFFLLFLAAVTSSLSMLQPGIAFLEESMEIGRHRSVAVLGFITAIGSGFVVYFSKDLKALDTIDFWVGTFLIFVLATVQIIIFGWVIGIKRGLEMANQGASFPVPKIYGFIMKFITPAFLLTIFALWTTQNVFGYNIITGQQEYSSYWKDLFIEPNGVARFSVLLIIIVASFIAFLATIANKFKFQNEGENKS